MSRISSWTVSNGLLWLGNVNHHFYHTTYSMITRQFFKNNSPHSIIVVVVIGEWWWWITLHKISNDFLVFENSICCTDCTILVVLSKALHNFVHVLWRMYFSLWTDNVTTEYFTAHSGWMFALVNSTKFCWNVLIVRVFSIV